MNRCPCILCLLKRNFAYWDPYIFKWEDNINSLISECQAYKYIWYEDYKNYVIRKLSQ